MDRKINLRNRRGTSLIELMVVIVIFAVGILAVLQIFPRGFFVISNNRNLSMMRALAQEEFSRLTARPDQLAEMVIPASYQWVAGNVLIVSDPNKSPNDFGPFTNRIDSNGNLLDLGGNNLGNISYMSGSNHFRRVVGEGGRIPAPRRAANQMASLMTLQFAPVLFSPTTFTVYGNDLVKRGGAPGGRTIEWQYFVEDIDEPTGLIYLYQSPTVAIDYRLAITIWVNNGTTNERRDIIDTVISVLPGAGGYVSYDPAANLVGVGETYLGAEFDSVRINRKFVQIPISNAFTDLYQYKMLDDALGLVLLNPAGYNATVPRQGGRRVPLTARVNYDVFDWRILREEFRVPDAQPATHRLKIGNLLHKNRPGITSKPHPGLNVLVNDETGGSTSTENRDFLLIDLDTGGIVSKSSFLTDYSLGSVKFVDLDNNPSNGTQVNLYFTGDPAPYPVTAEGRAVRALYMATGDFAVQVTKAANSYRGSLGRPTTGEYYAGGSRQYFLGAPLVPGESSVRVYFPPMDVGKKVEFGTLWYTDSNGILKNMQNQSFLISSSPIDTVVGLPYIDLRTYDNSAVAINYAQYGYATRNVKGASITVRTFWNPNVFSLTADEATNLQNFEKWAQNWRTVKVEGFIQKEEE